MTQPVIGTTSNWCYKVTGNDNRNFELVHVNLNWYM